MGLTGGVFGTGSTFMASSLQALSMAGVSELALHLDLPPPLANSLSAITGAVTGAVLQDPSSIPQSLRSLAPTIAQELAFTGISLAGNALGFDPRVTSLIGTPISGAIGAQSITGSVLKY